MTQTAEGRVRVSEPKSFAAAHIIEAEGYFTEGCKLVAVGNSVFDVPACGGALDYIDILIQRPSIKIWWGLREKKQDPYHKGRLWVRSCKHSTYGGHEPLEAEVNSHWVLQVLGRENLQDMRGLAEKLAQTHEVRVDVNLKCETTRFKHIPEPWEYDDDL